MCRRRPALSSSPAGATRVLVRPSRVDPGLHVLFPPQWAMSPNSWTVHPVHRGLLPGGVLSVFAAVAFAAAMFLVASGTSRADDGPKRVLMLHSFGLRFKPWTNRAEVIRNEISRRMAVDIQD